MFRNRYNVIQQRILNNPSFQPSSFSSTGQNNRITPIANLLGRTGSSHLLLGLLDHSPTGQLTLSDLTGSIAIDLHQCEIIPADSAYFCPGMLVLVDGTYVEDGGNAASGTTSALGNTGGIGGTISGRFVSSVMGHPPPERRSATLGIHDSNDASVKEEDGTISGPAFGWTDFLGVGSARATSTRMKRLEQRILSGPVATHAGNAKIAIAAEINLDVPTTLSALRTMLSAYASLPTSEYPMAIVLMGNFISQPAMSGVPGTGSIEYKEAFNSLATVLAEFPELIARTTLVFIPGENDAWASSFAGGAASPLPRKAIPEIFTSRVKRVVAEANREIGKGKGRKEGEAVWSSNPGRLSWFGCLGEMVLFRDDIFSRLRRTAIRFQNQSENEEGAELNADETMSNTADDAMQSEPPQLMDIDRPAVPNTVQDQGIDPDIMTARRLTKTLLDQSHLSPFPLATRPVLWDFASALQLYPLPSALVVADPEAPAFALNYVGCCVMNPGRIVEGRKGDRARWVEFDVRERKAIVRVQ